MYFCDTGLYYGITIAIVSLATGCTVFTLNIHHKGIHGAPVPDIVRTICLKFFARLFCMRPNAESTLDESVSGSVCVRCGKPAVDELVQA